MVRAAELHTAYIARESFSDILQRWLCFYTDMHHTFNDLWMFSTAPGFTSIFYRCSYLFIFILLCNACKRWLNHRKWMQVERKVNLQYYNMIYIVYAHFTILQFIFKHVSLSLSLTLHTQMWQSCIYTNLFANHFKTEKIHKQSHLPITNHFDDSSSIFQVLVIRYCTLYYLL